MSTKKSKDSLGDRMKGFYESRTKTSLSRRQYTMIRIDGKAFHTYTRGLKRPFDDDLMEDMDNTAKYLCSKIQGAVCAFVQSDEISILLTDFAGLDTQAWFDYDVQKMTSISASYATFAFNMARLKRKLSASALEFDVKDLNIKEAHFDSRVFQLPIKYEVENYFIWRQQDTTRNSISSVAQSLYSQKELHGKNTNQMQEMIFQKGINWNDYAARYKRGRMIVKKIREENNTTRSYWVMEEPPIFTQERKYISNIIPNYV